MSARTPDNGLDRGFVARLRESPAATILAAETTHDGFSLIIIETTDQTGTHRCGYLQQSITSDGDVTVDDLDSDAETTILGGWTFGPTEDGWIGVDSAGLGIQDLTFDGEPLEGPKQPGPGEPVTERLSPADLHRKLRAVRHAFTPPADPADVSSLLGGDDGAQ